MWKTTTTACSTSDIRNFSQIIRSDVKTLEAAALPQTGNQGSCRRGIVRDKEIFRATRMIKLWT